MPQQTSTTILRGGLNLVTPAVAIPPGQCIAAKNYEPEVRGYRRWGGCERYDGRPRPSDASYWIIDFDAGTATIAAGATVTGATSSATGIAVVAMVVESGSFGGSNAAGYLVLYNVSGTFQDNENLQVSAVTKCIANGTATESGADNDTDNATWTRAAREARRAVIAKPTGSGAIRGLHAYNGSLYCFRDNVGGTAGAMFKATTSGWSAQTLGTSVVEFSTGTAEILEGSTVTQGGVTSTVRYVNLTSGTWSGGDARGYLVITGVAGGNYSAGVATSSPGSGSATLIGAETATSLPPGGRYDCFNHNFFGSLKSVLMYGANGVGPAFQWDGTYFVPIRTGLSDALEKPGHIAEYSNHLFLGYINGALLFSGTGLPLTYSTTNGAGEMTFGSPVTGLLASAASALMVYGRNRVSYNTGSDAADFVLVPLADDAGAVEWTVQQVGSSIHMDDAGVRKISTTQAFGGMRIGTVTEAIAPLIERKRRDGVTAVASIRYRKKDQYLLFFSDMTGLFVYFGRKNPEVMPFELPFQVSCAHAGVVTGLGDDEQLFVGTEDGWVMQLDVGTSFDGEEVEAYIRLPFNPVGSPTLNKRWHKATLELDATVQATISLVAEYGYGDSAQPPGIEEAFEVEGGGGFWNEANWNEFYWNSAAQGIAEAYLEGLGRNVSMAIVSNATHEDPHTLSALHLNFSMRGLLR